MPDARGFLHRGERCSEHPDEGEIERVGRRTGELAGYREGAVDWAVARFREN